MTSTASVRRPPRPSGHPHVDRPTDRLGYGGHLPPVTGHLLDLDGATVREDTTRRRAVVDGGGGGGNGVTTMDLRTGRSSRRSCDWCRQAIIYEKRRRRRIQAATGNIFV